LGGDALGVLKSISLAQRQLWNRTLRGTIALSGLPAALLVILLLLSMVGLTYNPSPDISEKGKVAAAVFGILAFFTLDFMKEIGAIDDSILPKLALALLAFQFLGTGTKGAIALVLALPFLSAVVGFSCGLAAAKAGPLAVSRANPGMSFTTSPTGPLWRAVLFPIKVIGLNALFLTGYVLMLAAMPLAAILPLVLGGPLILLVFVLYNAALLGAELMKMLGASLADPAGRPESPDLANRIGLGVHGLVLPRGTRREHRHADAFHVVCRTSRNLPGSANGADGAGSCGGARRGKSAGPALRHRPIVAT